MSGKIWSSTLHDTANEQWQRWLTVGVRVQLQTF